MSEVTITVKAENVFYCEHDDQYIGYGASPRLAPPTEHEDDEEWLADHCWECGRSREEIADAQLA